VAMAGSGRQHPLIKAFDADQRIRTHYANVDFPDGSYDEEPIQFIKGSIRLRINLPRPRTRFDRVLSFPVTKHVDPAVAAQTSARYAQDMASYSAKAAITGGLYTLFVKPENPPNPEQFEVVSKEAIFDAYMKLDANFESVPPAQCMRMMNFSPITVPIGPVSLTPNFVQALEFFTDNNDDRNQWTVYANILNYSKPEDLLNAYFKGNLISEWDTIFQTDIAPLIVEALVNAMRLDNFAIDLTSLDKYHGGDRLMDLNVLGTTTKTRGQLPTLLTMTVNRADIRNLANYATVILDSASINYSTRHFTGPLYTGPVGDDLLDSTGATLVIPENDNDKRNPKREDRYLSAKLIEHLNSNLEYYNRVLWLSLDPERRYLLIDGFSIQVYDKDGNPIAPDKGGMRSLASVVKNEMITVTGNSLVLPVAPGYRVSGAFVQATGEGAKEPVTLLDHYRPLTPMDPYRVSVPSRGVFAEAVQGACNACEKIETERLQDWNRFPNIDEPTPIGSVTVPTPTVIDWRANYKDFAAPIVNVQNAPTAPAPGAGLAGLADLLSKSGVFKDITGLDANQQNALKTYLSNNENAKAFAEMAKDMAMQQHNTQNSGKIMDQITAAKQSGDITKQEAGELTKDHLQQQIDGGATKKAQLDADRQAASPSLSKAAVDAVSQGKDVTAARTATDGSSESITVGPGASTAVLAAEVSGVPPLQQGKNMDCWAVCATMMMSWKKGQSLSVEVVVAAAGTKYLDIYRADTGLSIDDKAEFLSALGMVAEPPASVLPQQYADWMKAFGPLWVTTDADSAVGQFSLHARILVKISGDPAGDGSKVQMTFIDPASGQQEPPESFPNFIAEFEQTVTDNPGKALAIQVAHFADRLPSGTEGGRPTPAQKTGLGAVSRLGGDSVPAASKSRIDGLVTGLGKLIDGIGQGIANWKDAPDADLVTSVEDSLYSTAKEALKEEALDAAKKIPGLGLLVTATQVSVVIADAVGQHLDEVNIKLKSTYDDATAHDPGSDGYTPDDIAALRNATNYQLNAVIGMRDILINTATDLAEKVATNLATLLSKQVIKGICGTLVKSLVTKLVDSGPIGAFVSNAVNVARSAIPSTTRQQVYGQSLALLLRLFVRQLRDQSTRDRLKGLAGLAGNGKPLEKRLVEGLVGMVVDPMFQALDVKFKNYAYGEIRNLFDELRSAGIAVEAGSNASVVIASDKVTVPQNALLRIESGDAAADADQAVKLFELREMWNPLAMALGAKLTLLSRTQLPVLKKTYDKYPENFPDASAAYHDSLLSECAAFRDRYLAAAGSLSSSTLLNSDAVPFQYIDFRNGVFSLLMSSRFLLQDGRRDL
jgi:hypothetical protein